jgi:hypothetical protein
MSKRLLNLVIRTYELKGAAYQVMLALAWNSSATNECSISISDLAADAHLTKKSVIVALQLLTSAHCPTDRRSILTKAKHGIGVGIPNTYLIDLELLRDLNRRRRLPSATTDQGRRAGDTPTPGWDSTNDSEAGNGATLAERREVPTLRGQTNQEGVRDCGLLGSARAIPLSRREVTRRMKAHAKQSARDMIGMLTGSEKIPWMAEQSSAELLEDALPTRAGNGPSPEAVGAVAPECCQACNTLIDGHVEQPLFPKRYSLRPSRGAQPLSVATYSDGIRWPRR